MEKLPTAEEFIEDVENCFSEAPYSSDVFKEKYATIEKMKEFAKLHVKAALETASRLAVTKTEGAPQIGVEYDVVDKESIIDAYPLSNIK